MWSAVFWRRNILHLRPRHPSPTPRSNLSISSFCNLSATLKTHKKYLNLTHSQYSIHPQDNDNRSNNNRIVVPNAGVSAWNRRHEKDNALLQGSFKDLQGWVDAQGIQYWGPSKDLQGKSTDWCAREKDSRWLSWEKNASQHLQEKSPTRHLQEKGAPWCLPQTSISQWKMEEKWGEHLDRDKRNMDCERNEEGKWNSPIGAM